MSLSRKKPAKRKSNLSLEGLEDVLEGSAKGSSKKLPKGYAQGGKREGRAISGGYQDLERELFEARAQAGLLSDMLKDYQTRLDGASMLIGCQRAQLADRAELARKHAHLELTVERLNEEVGDFMNALWEADKRIMALEDEIGGWMNRCWQSDTRLVTLLESFWHKLGRLLRVIAE